MLSWSTVVSLRMERLSLSTPSAEEEYDALFEDLSPVPTAGWVEPGSPPALPGHVNFDDGAYNALRRQTRAIRKGRFGNRVAYVTAEDWELFACLYQKPLLQPTVRQNELLELLDREGPLNIGLMKEITGLLVKEITPVLHRLQEAFLVYEDQTDGDGDRGWYSMRQEFPDLDLGRYTKEETLGKLLPRLAHRMVFLTAEMAAEFYAQPIRMVRTALDQLAQEQILIPAQAGGQTGYLLPEDAKSCAGALCQPQRGVIALQRNDPLVRCLGKKEKAMLSQGDEALYYLLIDGEIQGAVCGRFKFGPHVLENVSLTIPPEQAKERKDEIIDAVYTVFDRAASPLARYCGEPTGYR